jgi:hypothetical protein
MLARASSMVILLVFIVVAFIRGLKRSLGDSGDLEFSRSDPGERRSIHDQPQKRPSKNVSFLVSSFLSSLSPWPDRRLRNRRRPTVIGPPDFELSQPSLVFPNVGSQSLVD